MPSSRRNNDPAAILDMIINTVDDDLASAFLEPKELVNGNMDLFPDVLTWLQVHEDQFAELPV